MTNSLLDLTIKGYDNGGLIDFDPYSYTTLNASLDALGVELLGGIDARLEIPTYDKTPQDMIIEGYNLQEKGYGQALDTAQRKGAESLFGMTETARDSVAKSDFVGAGAQERQMEAVRKSLVDDFADTQRDIGLQRDQSYLGLQKDIYDIQQAYQDSVMSALGAMPEEDWRFREGSHTFNRPADGQNPPTYDGQSPGETAKGGDGQTYTWQNGQWVNTDELAGGNEGSGIYTSIPSTNVGNQIVVDTGSGSVWYTWNSESNSYERSQGSGGVGDPTGGGSGGIDKP